MKRNKNALHFISIFIKRCFNNITAGKNSTPVQVNLDTFKLVDQLSGRTLGLRADITPQVARIDAHLLNRKGVTRLCYSGSVLHTQPAGLMRTREPLQIGAELYGHRGVESDIEIQHLMLKSLALLGIEGVHLDLGHVSLFRALAKVAGISKENETEFLPEISLTFDAV